MRTEVMAVAGPSSAASCVGDSLGGLLTACSVSWFSGGGDGGAPAGTVAPPSTSIAAGGAGSGLSTLTLASTGAGSAAKSRTEISGGRGEIGTKVEDAASMMASNWGSAGGFYLAWGKSAWLEREKKFSLLKVSTFSVPALERSFASSSVSAAGADKAGANSGRFYASELRHNFWWRRPAFKCTAHLARAAPSQATTKVV